MLQLWLQSKNIVRISENIVRMVRNTNSYLGNKLKFLTVNFFGVFVFLVALIFWLRNLEKKLFLNNEFACAHILLSCYC